MGPKRVSDDDISDISQATKIPKIEHGIAPSPLTQQRPPNSDFSGSVKKKLANSTRTGQACDRCKIRKIRCDGRPEGCSPCAQNRTPCTTTDRITGRAVTRGHTEAMEAENNYLKAQVAELQTQLKELGAEPRVVSSYGGFSHTALQWPSSALGSESQTWPDTSQRRTSTSSLPGYTPTNGVETNEYRPLPQFKANSIGDNYLGVSSADSLLSHIKGTSLSVFGTEIDITDFIDTEADYEKSVMSYDHFLSIVLNEDTNTAYVPFPSYQELHDYSTWFLRSLNPYTMLLDKPTFMHLIFQIGNDPAYSPSPSDTVCVHMMLATIKYQISMRNGEASMMEESHKHYRYSLSFFKYLMHGHTWRDVQALTMMCHHMRNFPKPGAAWIICSTTFLLAVELGLHRSTKAWADSSKMDKLEIEMRKRIFWTLHALSTNLSGKLGRPMPIGLDEIDVEFPDPINDCLPEEDAILTPFRKCSFNVGIQTAKYTIWSSELYSTVYAVRQSARSYDETLRRLETGIQRWREETPVELRDPKRAASEDLIFSLYLESWYLEYQLLLHHPAVCRSTDPAIINANLDTCLEVSRKMLDNCNEMKKMKSLDIPWINTVVYVAAIFTTLFIYSQRRDQMSSAEMTKLRNDMGQWIDVMGECGQLLGSGDKLKHAVHRIVENSLNSINDNIVKRTATESLAQAALQTPQEQPAQPTYGNGDVYGLAASNTPYISIPTSAPYAYSNGAATVSSHAQPNSAFDQQAYSGGSEDAAMTPSHAAALAAAASGVSSQPGNGTYSYATSTQLPSNNHQLPYTANGMAPQEWYQWSRTYTQQVAPAGDYMNTATTLVSLGARDGSSAPGQEGTGAVEGGGLQAQGPPSSNYQWPGILFSGGTNGHVGQH